MSLINERFHTPVRRLRCFEENLWELGERVIAERYWKHLEHHMGRCEDYWKRHPDRLSGRARPNSARANGIRGSPSEVALRGSECENKKREEMILRKGPSKIPDSVEGGALEASSEWRRRFTPMCNKAFGSGDRFR